MCLIEDDLFHSANTPADDSWTLAIWYRNDDQQDGGFATITYLSTGEIDNTRTTPSNLSAANSLLAPAISLIRSAALQQGIDIEFWRFMNWVVVSHYWLLLATVGQVNPVYYPPLNFTQDFPNLKSYLSANNIFVNASLYNIYSTYFTTTILPLVRLPSPEFAPHRSGTPLSRLDRARNKLARQGGDTSPRWAFQRTHW